jgi:hypothetical protein
VKQDPKDTRRLRRVEGPEITLLDGGIRASLALDVDAPKAEAAVAGEVHVAHALAPAEFCSRRRDIGRSEDGVRVTEAALIAVESVGRLAREARLPAALGADDERPLLPVDVGLHDQVGLGLARRAPQSGPPNEGDIPEAAEEGLADVVWSGWLFH